MNRIQKGDIIFSFVVLILVVIFFFESIYLAGTAGRVPLIVGIPTLLLAVYNVLYKIISRGFTSTESKPRDVSREILEISWLGIMFIMIICFGLIIFSGMYMFFYLRFHSKENWSTAVGLGAAMTVGCYLIFVKLLHMNLFKGFIIELF